MVRTFHLYWKSGKFEVIRGHDKKDAFKNAGYDIEHSSGVHECYDMSKETDPHLVWDQEDKCWYPYHVLYGPSKTLIS